MTLRVEIHLSGNENGAEVLADVAEKVDRLRREINGIRENVEITMVTADYFSVKFKTDDSREYKGGGNEL